MIRRSGFEWIPRMRTGAIAVVVAATLAGLVAVVLAGYRLSVRWSSGAVELAPARRVNEASR